MSDQKIIDTIAEAARAYFDDVRRDGYVVDGVDGDGSGVAILAALRANNIALVELPAETTIPAGWDGDCLGAWPLVVELRMASRYVDPVSAWPKGEIALPDGYFMPVAEARSLAAALLAASERAE